MYSIGMKVNYLNKKIKNIGTEVIKNLLLLNWSNIFFYFSWNFSLQLLAIIFALFTPLTKILIFVKRLFFF